MMNYLKKYNISEEEINDLKERYNDNIIKFLSENEIFIEEKLEFLKNENYIIYPILENNIKIFLEIMPELERKIEEMKNKNFSKKQIQMILMDEELYDKF